MKVSHKLKLWGVTGVLVGLIVTVGGGWTLHEWYKPDVRYEEGSWYITGEGQVTQLRLTNVGHSDAERVLITVDFNEPLRNIASGSPHRPFSVSSGGLGTKTITGSVDRLVPGETLNIFFETDRVEPVRPREQYVTIIVFDGGMGKMGQPPRIFSAAGALLGIASFVVGGLLALVFASRGKKLLGLLPPEEEIERVMEDVKSLNKWIIEQQAREIVPEDFRARKAS